MTVGELVGLGVILADESVSRGAYELFEARTPKGLGPPTHVHDEREEAFYVVSGRFRIVCGDKITDAGPGEFVMVPRGTPHSFEALDDGARMVFIVSPPGLEGFFREGAELRASGRPDLEVRQELARRYDSRPVPTSKPGTRLEHGRRG
jgi:mannose-6-phosphate isomerase-like protein (cupin superfamily)